MALILGRGDITVITAGLLMALGGIYIYGLVSPATRQFMGAGWPETLCRISAVIVGLLMMASGLCGSIGGLRDMLILQNPVGLNLMLIGFLPLCWGLYILKLAIKGIPS